MTAQGTVVGLIGLNHPHVAGYLRGFEALDVDGVALSDPDPTVLAQYARTSSKSERLYIDPDTLLARRDIDVVLLTLPTDQAPAMIVRAARAGKHVICEKPAARSAVEFQPVVEVLAAGSTHFTVPYLWRTHPAIRQIRVLIDRGVLGQIQSFELRLVTTRVGLRDPSHWLFRRPVAGGGILTWLGCHWLDLLLYLGGQDVEAVSALEGTLSGEAIDVEDVASLGIRLRNGAIGTLLAGYLLPAGPAGYEGTTYDQSISLWGTDGFVRYHREGDDHVVSCSTRANRFDGAPDRTFRFNPPASAAYGGIHGLEFLANFIRLAQTGDGVNAVTARDAWRVLTILDAARESVRSGQTVYVR